MTIWSNGASSLAMARTTFGRSGITACFTRRRVSLVCDKKDVRYSVTHDLDLVESRSPWHFSRISHVMCMLPNNHFQIDICCLFSRISHVMCMPPTNPPHFQIDIMLPLLQCQSATVHAPQLSNSLLAPRLFCIASKSTYLLSAH